MILRLKYLIFLLPCLGFVSLDNGPDFVDFKEWYSTNKNQLIFESEYADLIYQVRYNPVELKLMSAILRDEIKPGKKEVKKWYLENDTYTEFSFKISTMSGKDLFIEYSDDKQQYNDKLYYFIEPARFDFSLIRTNDTISPIHYQFENSYGTAPFITVYVAFEKRDKNNPIKEFIFNDRIFNNQVIPFDVNRLNNLNIPKIK